MKTLVLLVGSNPLPNYLTAMALKPECVVLVYSQQTKEPKERLRKVLGDKGFSRIEEECVIATDAKHIRDKLQALFAKHPADTHLNYTGGTKTMAAHARMVFAAAKLPDGNASYLDERDAVIRFDDGTAPIELANKSVELDLEITLALHGAVSSVQPELPRLADATAIATAVFSNPQNESDDTRGPKLAGKLYRLHRKENGNLLSLSAAKIDVCRISQFGLSLSIDDFPGADWNKDGFKDWSEFLGGLWFEQWVASVVRNVIGIDGVHCNVECTRSNREFELDVVIIRGHRVHVLSCTTDTTLKLCKSKLFEVATRAAQVGGELARSAVACLLNGRNDDGGFVEQLRDDVASLWDSPNGPKVFGYEDVKQWLGQSEIGVPPDTSELKRWLES